MKGPTVDRISVIYAKPDIPLSWKPLPCRHEFLSRLIPLASVLPLPILHSTFFPDGVLFNLSIRPDTQVRFY